MTLPIFISTYDRPGSIVLLEGKREVDPIDAEKLVELGRLLAAHTKHILFRSGNATGSDFLFSSGVAAIDKTRLQVITPKDGHRTKETLTDDIISLDRIDLAREPKVVYQSKLHKGTQGIIEPFAEGKNRNKFSSAAYIIRDTVKVIGTSDIPPATFGIFYDDLSDPEAGGTGHTMKTCRLNNVPLIDQRTWFGWLG